MTLTQFHYRRGNLDFYWYMQSKEVGEYLAKNAENNSAVMNAKRKTVRNRCGFVLLGRMRCGIMKPCEKHCVCKDHCKPV